MRITLLAILPFLLAGFVLPDDNCGKIPPAGNPFDGPYVMYQDKQLLVHYILDDGGNKAIKTDSFTVDQKGTAVLNVATDQPGESFTVNLKPALENEKTEYAGISKLFVVSDIEGNFRTFRKLLVNNGVMDDKFNWTFGNGHLVLTGDFFDRGDHVTEVLWLIYSLEEKAKAAGGYVHFILGNHEIMNMGNDFRYVHPKYMESAVLLNLYYGSFFGEKSELGKWLRTKNIMEKINDILFVHGGVSQEVNTVDLSVSKVNKLARPWYPDTTYKYRDPRVELLFSDIGPFWYRGYYTGKIKASHAQIDSTLRLYGVNHIATGHTVIADTISVLFDGKVFNTDVHHVKGFSEGLLYQDGKYYRASQLGERFQIGN